MIVFDDVSYAYEPGYPVCSGLNLELGKGLILLLGPNGSGKSTLLKLASGVEKPDKGRVLVDGRDLWREEAAARQTLAYLPEFPDLTPYARLDEILSLVCRLRECPEREGRQALSFFGLQDVAHQTVRELSWGQRRRAAFAAVLVGTPSNILLDEPLDGMDRAAQEKILEWINSRVKSGALVVIISHTVEPFAASSSGLVSIKKGQAFYLQDLPEDPRQRLRLIDEMSRGG
jgi:ABC-type multidrug transport system ATPase subunit